MGLDEAIRKLERDLGQKEKCVWKKLLDSYDCDGYVLKEPRQYPVICETCDGYNRKLSCYATDESIK